MEETFLVLLGSEYGTVIKALEFMIAACPEAELPEHERRKAYLTLERLLVEGGELGPEELVAMRKRFGVTVGRVS